MDILTGWYVRIQTNTCRIVSYLHECCLLFISLCYCCYIENMISILAQVSNRITIVIQRQSRNGKVKKRIHTNAYRVSVRQKKFCASRSLQLSQNKCICFFHFLSRCTFLCCSGIIGYCYCLFLYDSNHSLCIFQHLAIWIYRFFCCLFRIQSVSFVIRRN